jgi:hypothetical protein
VPDVLVADEDAASARERVVVGRPNVSVRDKTGGPECVSFERALELLRRVPQHIQQDMRIANEARSLADRSDRAARFASRPYTLLPRAPPASPHLEEAAEELVKWLGRPVRVQHNNHVYTADVVGVFAGSPLMFDPLAPPPEPRRPLAVPVPLDTPLERPPEEEALRPPGGRRSRPARLEPAADRRQFITFDEERNGRARVPREDSDKCIYFTIKYREWFDVGADDEEAGEPREAFGYLTRAQLDPSPQAHYSYESSVLQPWQTRKDRGLDFQVRGGGFAPSGPQWGLRPQTPVLA